MSWKNLEFKVWVDVRDRGLGRDIPKLLRETGSTTCHTQTWGAMGICLNHSKESETVAMSSVEELMGKVYDALPMNSNFGVMIDLKDDQGNIIDRVGIPWVLKDGSTVAREEFMDRYKEEFLQFYFDSAENGSISQSAFDSPMGTEAYT